MPLRRNPRFAGLMAIISCALVALPVAAEASPRQAEAPSATPFAGAGVSPAPGSTYAESGTEISFIGLHSRDVAGIAVTGSKTGRHTGRYVSYSTGAGASFLPAKPFAVGERVTVAAPFRIAGTSGKTFSFTIAKPTNTTPVLFPAGPTPTIATQSFASAPDLHPAQKMTVVSTSTTPGDLFTTPTSGTALNGLEIDDSSGNLVYYKPVAGTAANLREQTYRGQPVLTWWDGTVLFPGYGEGKDFIADSSYTIIKTISAGNGLIADSHDFAITPQGTALITVYQPEFADTRSVRGKASDVVFDSVIQEIDIATNRVMFEWHALDHLPLTDSYQPYVAGTGPYDFAHINSIQPFGSNELMVSLRNTHTVITLNRLTGAVTRRIGGRRPTVHEPAIAGTHSQHDAEPHSDGTISLFDNGLGAGPFPHPSSRGLVLKLVGNTISVVRILGAPNGELAGSQGSMQVLNSGSLVDFAVAGSIVEYDAAGNVRTDQHYPKGVSTYRAFKAGWHATPSTGPTLAATTGSSGTVVRASWNGATEVASWRLLGGPDAQHLSTLATAARNGFETTFPAVAAAGGLLTAQALDSSGHVLAATTPVTIG